MIGDRWPLFSATQWDEREKSLCKHYEETTTLQSFAPFTTILNLVEILAQEKWLAVVCLLVGFDCIGIELLDVSTLPSRHLSTQIPCTADTLVQIKSDGTIIKYQSEDSNKKKLYIFYDQSNARI